MRWSWWVVLAIGCGSDAAPREELEVDIAVETNDVAVDSEDVAVDSDDVAVDTNDVAVDSDDVAVDSDDVAVDSDDVAVDSASDTSVDSHEVDATTGPDWIAFEQPLAGATWRAGSAQVIRLRLRGPDFESVPPWAFTAVAEVALDDGPWTALDGPRTADGLGLVSWRLDAPTGQRLAIRARVALDPTFAPADGTVGYEVSAIELALAPSGRRDCYAWTQVTPAAAFAPRDGAGALVKDGRMWLIGGWNPLDPVAFPEITVNDVWSSDDGYTWRNDLPNDPPGTLTRWERRHKAGYAVFDDALWILGGDLSAGHMQPDVWRSADGVTWTEVSPRTPWGERVLHMVWVHAGAIWVMGGQTLPQFGGPSEEVFYNDVWRSYDGADWERVLEHAPWSPRGMMGGEAVHRGRMWILGGGTYDTPARPAREFDNDVWSSADGVAWREDLAEAPWAGRQYHEVAVWDDRLFVLEGYGRDEGNRNDVWYSDDGVSWYELTGTPWAPRHAASIFVHAGALWVVTGNNLTPDVWRLDCSPSVP